MLASSASAKLIRVPEDVPTIQGAVNQAEIHDEIRVGPGDYHERIILKSGIKLLGGPSVILLGSPDYGRIVIIDGITSVTLEGFTLRYGRDEPNTAGGGMLLRNVGQDVKIMNCRVEYNTSWGASNGPYRSPYVYGKGGGLSCIQASPMISNSVFAHNVSHFGGGVHVDGGTPVFTNCLFLNNRVHQKAVGSGLVAGYIGGYGGGIYSSGGGPRFINCLFHGNSGGGIYAFAGELINSIVWGNVASNGSSQIVAGDGFQIRRSCIMGGVGGHSQDPRFVNPGALDFHLRSDSPLIDAAEFVPGLTTDFYGVPRGYNGFSGPPRGDGSDYDIGPFEYEGPTVIQNGVEFTIWEKYE